MSSLALNTVFEIVSNLFSSKKHDSKNENSLENRLKTKEDILYFDKMIHEMKQNNEKERIITLPSDKSKLKIRLK